MNNPLDEIKELLKNKHFNTLDEANRFIQEHMERKNATPLEDLGGLSPIQMGKLLHTPFDSNGSPVIFNRDLSEEELKNALFYCEARKFLNLMKDNSPIPATVSGNLNREFVSSAMNISDYETADIKQVCKVINEQDFFWLNVTRIIFELAGFVRLADKKFSVTKKGRNILLAQPGDLYYALFDTFLRKFNLAYLDRLNSEMPEIQQFINFPIYMARSRCNDWMSVREFVEMVLVKGLSLDKVYKAYLEQPYHSDRLIWAGSSRIIRPLVYFGLLEMIDPAEEKKELFSDKIRRTPLLEKFINFDFSKGTN